MKLLSLLATLVLAASASAQTGDPLAPIKAALKDPAKPFTLIVEFQLKPGSSAAVKTVIEAGVKATREEPGNLAYACHQDAQNADTLVFVEIWKSLAALESHVATPYTQALLGRIGEFSAAPMKARVLTPFAPAATTEASKRRITAPADATK